VDGLTAWLAEGLPGEGLRTPERVANVMRRDLPRLTPETTVDELPGIMGDWDVAVVVGPDGVVVGTVRAEAQAGPSGLSVERVMHTAPTTVRPSITISELARSMDESGEGHMLVTTPGGRLLGMTRREDLNG
jgi:CBS domain-containing protein